MIEGSRTFRNLLARVVVTMVSFGAVSAELAAQTPLAIEAEALLGWADASEGELRLDDLRQLGEDLRTSRQLLWTPTREGARLRLDATVSRGGRYEVLVLLTVAPDRGIVEMSLGGDLQVTLNAYEAAPGLIPVSLGIHELVPGPYELLFRIVGKDPSSSGHALGIDRIDLVRLNERRRAP